MSGLTEDDLLHALWTARDFLRAGRVKSVVIGARAVSIWGRPRATLDLDFQVLADAAGLERLRGAAPSQGFAVDETWLDWDPLLRESQIRLL